MLTLLVTADALRADHLAQYGYRRDTMPELSALTDEGCLYRRAFANGAHTQISVASFLTSRLNGLRAVEEGPTVASALDREGVATAGIHSNVVVSTHFDRVAGFETLYDLTDDAEAVEESSAVESARGALTDAYASGLGAVASVAKRLPDAIVDPLGDAYARLRPDIAGHEPTLYVDAERVTDLAIDWLDEHEGDDAFLWVHYMEPHRPYGYYDPDPVYADREMSGRQVLELMAEASLNPGTLSGSRRELMIDLYDSDVRYMSKQIGRLFSHLRAGGRWDETNVIFTSDHGEEFGEHGLYYHRNWPYDELVHVPLVVRTPESASGVSRGLQQLLDVAPTALDLHDVSIPDGFEGRPLEVGSGGADDADGPRTDTDAQADGAEAGTGESERRPIVASSLRETFAVAARTDRWKYVHTSDDEAVLYDLEADPGERRSVLDGHPDVARSLRERVPEDVYGIPSAASGTDREFDQETERRLEDLGYL